jgi:hypothetical protein
MESKSEGTTQNPVGAGAEPAEHPDPESIIKYCKSLNNPKLDLSSSEGGSDVSSAVYVYSALY